MRVGIAAVITGLLLAACVTDGPRDAGGGSISLSEPRTIEWAEARTNLPLFFDEPKLIIRRTVRDNGTINIEDYSVEGSGLLRTQYAMEGWFSATTEQRVANRDEFEQFVARFGLDPVNVRQVKDVTRSLRGHYAEKGNCWAVRLSVRLKPLTIFDNDRGLADTVLSGRGCHYLARPMAEIIERLDVNNDDQRAAIRTHRAALMAGE